MKNNPPKGWAYPIVIPVYIYIHCIYISPFFYHGDISVVEPFWLFMASKWLHGCIYMIIYISTYVTIKVCICICLYIYICYVQIYTYAHMASSYPYLTRIYIYTWDYTYYKSILTIINPCQMGLYIHIYTHMLHVLNIYQHLP